MNCRIAVAVLLLPGILPAQERAAAKRLTTPGGVSYGMVGEKAATPSPTLFIFSNTVERSLGDPDFNRLGLLLRQRKGFILVSLDMPAHGQDRRPGDTKTQLAGWRERLAGGEDIVASLMPKVSAVLDALVANGTTDPARVGAYGISRGGFMALHFAAVDPRIKWLVAFSPVTDLLALDEFNGMAGNAQTRALAVVRVASRLAGRPIWMSIGNNDDRVGTDKAIALSRRIVEESLAQGKLPNVELHIYATRGHSSIPAQHDTAADWWIAQMEKKD